jgi:electron transport complex protein RnfE
MGGGFILILIALGGIREILGSGSIFGIQLLGDWFNPWMVMVLPPGAFITLGLLIASGNWINDRRTKI